jgi:hypothetical protein
MRTNELAKLVLGDGTDTAIEEQALNLISLVESKMPEEVKRVMDIVLDGAQVVLNGALISTGQKNLNLNRKNAIARLASKFLDLEKQGLALLISIEAVLPEDIKKYAAYAVDTVQIAVNGIESSAGDEL